MMGNNQGGKCLACKMHGKSKAATVNKRCLQAGYPCCGEDCCHKLEELIQGDPELREAVKEIAKKKISQIGSSKASDDEQFEIVLQCLVVKKEALDSARMERWQAMAHSRIGQFMGVGKVATDIQLLRDELYSNLRGNHLQVAACLDAAIKALENGQPIDPSCAVLPRGGSVTTYSERIIEIFKGLSGSVEAPLSNAEGSTFSLAGAAGSQPVPYLAIAHGVSNSSMSSSAMLMLPAPEPKVSQGQPPGGMKNAAESTMGPAEQQEPAASSQGPASEQQQKKKRKKSGASKGKAIKLTLGTLGGVAKGAFTGTEEEFEHFVKRKGMQVVPVRCLKKKEKPSDADGIARIAEQYRRSKKIQEQLQGDNMPSAEASPEAWEAYLLQQEYTVPGFNVSSADVNSDDWSDIVSQLWADYQEDPAAQDRPKKKRKTSTAEASPAAAGTSAPGKSSAGAAAGAAATAAGSSTPGKSSAGAAAGAGAAGAGAACAAAAADGTSASGKSTAAIAVPAGSSAAGAGAACAAAGATSVMGATPNTGKVFEGPWTEAFEQRVRTVVKFFNVPIDKLTAAGVSAVAAAYKAEAAMLQRSSLVNAPSPDAESTEWEAWLTSSDGPYDSGNIAVKFNMMEPEAQLRKLQYHWQKLNGSSA